MAFLLIVTGREAKSTDGTIVGHDGDRYWVCVEPDGWVDATSSPYRPDEGIPSDTKAFASEEAARKFAKRWKGHPWWCVPNGEAEVVEVKPKTRRIISGWEKVGA